ncbi:MAG TPA: 2-hydroxyacyl-CoA dehydratase family protein [Dehalococcoidia bacterium]|nr:2-hydroxyacyl-CoA dehydratase family protein [Dehalococcoidia bacterium]
MSVASGVLDRLSYQGATALSAEAIADWKAKGGKVVGWLCIYAPEEVLHAAGILPIRIMGSPEPQSIADAYLQSNMCPFVRSCLSQGLLKEYSFLDGVLASHTCDAMVKLYDTWRLFVGAPFAFIIDQPHVINRFSHEYHLEEMKRLVGDVESFAGVTITPEALSRSIKVYNENRRLLRELYELRRADTPPITGSQIHDVVRAGMLLPKEEHNLLLKELLAELPGRPAPKAAGPRLMVSGSCIDTPIFPKIVEEAGGQVVVDDLCFGSRYFWDLVGEEGDPLQALSRRYMDKTHCACIPLPRDSRYDFMRQLIQDYRVQGVIFYGQKFCDPYAYDFPEHKPRLEKDGIPVMQLEVEHASVGAGQLKTRVQAFVEMIR